MIGPRAWLEWSDSGWCYGEFWSSNTSLEFWFYLALGPNSIPQKWFVRWCMSPTYKHIFISYLNQCGTLNSNLNTNEKWYLYKQRGLWQHCVLTLSIVFVSKEEEKKAVPKVVPKMVIQISFLGCICNVQTSISVSDYYTQWNLRPSALNVIYGLMLQVQIDSDYWVISWDWVVSSIIVYVFWTRALLEWSNFLSFW